MGIIDKCCLSFCLYLFRTVTHCGSRRCIREVQKNRKLLNLIKKKSYSRDKRDENLKVIELTSNCLKEFFLHHFAYHGWAETILLLTAAS